MRPVVWSHSSLNTWQSCHLQWYFTYVMGLEEEPSEAKTVGIAVHDYAEWALKVAAGTYGGERKEGLPAAMVPLVEVFRNDVLPTFQNPVLIEAPFQLEIDDIPVSGVIDAVDAHAIAQGVDAEGLFPGETFILRDLKTTAKKPRPGRYRLQVTLYWLGATDLGYQPDAARLDWIVRTQKPYYHPEDIAPIDDTDIAVLAAALRSAQDGVGAEEYSPTGLGTTACSSCGHKAICGPYERFRETTDPKRKEGT
jgi:hypothetical protein